jgi:hypothetical protein
MLKVVNETIQKCGYLSFAFTLLFKADNLREHIALTHEQQNNFLFYENSRVTKIGLPESILTNYSS